MPEWPSTLGRGKKGIDLYGIFLAPWTRFTTSPKPEPRMMPTRGGTGQRDFNNRAAFTASEYPGNLLMRKIRSQKAEIRTK